MLSYPPPGVFCAAFRAIRAMMRVLGRAIACGWTVAALLGFRRAATVNSSCFSLGYQNRSGFFTTLPPTPCFFNFSIFYWVKWRGWYAKVGISEIRLVGCGCGYLRGFAGCRGPASLWKGLRDEGLF